MVVKALEPFAQHMVSCGKDPDSAIYALAEKLIV